MDRQLKALTALPDDLGLRPDGHGWLTIVCNSSAREFDTLF